MRMRLWLMGLGLITAVPVFAQDYTLAQNRIKSIYLYNFMKDVQWPTTSELEIRICLLQRNGLYQELDKFVTAKKVNNKVMLVKQVNSLSECSQCDLIFIEDQQLTKDKLKRPADYNGLIITSGFYDPSLSNLVLMFQDNKLQFSINMALCEKLGFRISSHLSALANQKMIQP
jgi:hypothetical protein